MHCSSIFSLARLGFFFVLYTTGSHSNSFWPAATLQWISVPSCLCHRDWVNRAHHLHHSHHSSSSLSRLFPLYHRISLGITGSFSRGRSMFASQIFVTFVTNRQVENGGSSLVFGKRSKTTKRKKKKEHESFWGRTRQRYLECDANLNLSHCVVISLFREWI